jgi:hypothetical protein
MGLLDKPLVVEEVREIRLNQLLAKEKKQAIRRLGLNLDRTQNTFKRNVPKRLREEWGERMQFIRNISRSS